MLGFAKVSVVKKGEHVTGKPHDLRENLWFPVKIFPIPMDPVVPSERKWDWGTIYYDLEG